MAKKDVAAIVSGAGWIGGLADKLIKALRERGVSDEQIHQLVTENGDAPVGKIADVLAETMKLVNGTVRLFVNYTDRSLKEMISDCRFDYVNPDITDKNFPVRNPMSPFAGDLPVTMKAFSTEELVGKTRSVTSEEVLQALKNKGYRPAELPEALAYAKANPDEQRKYPIVILGSVWRSFRDRLVPYLNGDDGERRLNLDWFYDGWSGDYRFLAVRK